MYLAYVLAAISARLNGESMRSTHFCDTEFVGTLPEVYTRTVLVSCELRRGSRVKLQVVVEKRSRPDVKKSFLWLLDISSSWTKDRKAPIRNAFMRGCIESPECMFFEFMLTQRGSRTPSLLLLITM